ncbi:MAG: LacI family DNA-binding transcriptional regulator [Acetivibrio ethanolgignens]
MATLKDVARLANVDVSTVSRALNNTSYVHPDTKTRILAAVKELSYQPNILAQGLRQGKRHTIGVVIPRLYMTVFAEILQGIEETARYLGYSTLICNTEDDYEVEKECLNRLRNGFVDGIIIAGTGKCGRLLRDIRTSGIPVIQIIRKQEKSISSVIADYEASGYNAVKYLVQKGCKEIGLINGPMNLAPYQERYKGYKKAIKEFELREICSESTQPTNSFEYGFQCAEELLNNNYMLDAIVVAVDVQGIGVLRALKEGGRVVPDDIKIVSLTGHIIGQMLETTMTAMVIPSFEMGKKATKMLVDEIDNPPKDGNAVQHLVFDTVLVERESS